MVSFKLGDLQCDMLTEVSEMTLEHFQQLEVIMAKEYEIIVDQNFDILKVLNISQEMLDIIQDEHLCEMMREYNNINFDTLLLTDLKKEIEIGGYVYTSEFNINDKGFFLTAKEVSIANKILKNHFNESIYMLFALVFKRKDLSIKEHQDMTHIKFKSKMMRDMNLEFALPFVLAITNRLTMALNTMIKRNDIK